MWAALTPALVLLCTACSTSTAATEADTSEIAAPEPDISADAGTDLDQHNTPSFYYLEIGTESERVAGLDCDAESAPGPDIDSATLYSNPSLLEVEATLSNCTWKEPTGHCPDNFAGDVSAAESVSDGSPVAGFVALNGGSILCSWSAQKSLQFGMLVVVTEIGAEVAPEPYRIRSCEDSAGASCGPWQTITGAEQTVPAGKLLPESTAVE